MYKSLEQCIRKQERNRLLSKQGKTFGVYIMNLDILCIWINTRYSFYVYDVYSVVCTLYTCSNVYKLWTLWWTLVCVIQWVCTYIVKILRAFFHAWVKREESWILAVCTSSSYYIVCILCIACKGQNDSLRRNNHVCNFFSVCCSFNNEYSVSSHQPYL